MRNYSQPQTVWQRQALRKPKATPGGSPPDPSDRKAIPQPGSSRESTRVFQIRNCMGWDGDNKEKGSPCRMTYLF